MQLNVFLYTEFLRNNFFISIKSLTKYCCENFMNIQYCHILGAIIDFKDIKPNIDNSNKYISV